MVEELAALGKGKRLPVETGPGAGGHLEIGAVIMMVISSSSSAGRWPTLGLLALVLLNALELLLLRLMPRLLLLLLLPNANDWQRRSGAEWERRRSWLRWRRRHIVGGPAASRRWRHLAFLLLLFLFLFLAFPPDVVALSHREAAALAQR